MAKHTDFDKPFAQLSVYMKSVRAENGLSQRLLAERMEVDHTYISKIEGQKIEMLPSVNFIKKLADIGNDPHWVVLSLVGHIDCKALEKRAASFQLAAELLGYIADGTLSDEDITFIVMETRHEKKVKS